MRKLRFSTQLKKLGKNGLEEKGKTIISGFTGYNVDKIIRTSNELNEENNEFKIDFYYKNYDGMNKKHFKLIKFTISNVFLPESSQLEIGKFPPLERKKITTLKKWFIPEFNEQSDQFVFIKSENIGKRREPLQRFK